MFTEREISKAISGLFDKFELENYQLDEEEFDIKEELPIPEVCLAVRNAMQEVYQYTVDGSYEKAFNYRGEELFDQRACLLISDIEQSVMDCATTFYETELWLMEDMSFSIVHCVTMTYGSEDMRYTSSYRVFKKKFENKGDLFFDPEDLVDELTRMCEPQWEHEATIYEL